MIKNSLQHKVILLIAGVSCALLGLSIVFGMSAIREASDTAQDISIRALENQAEDYIVRLTDDDAERHALLLERTLQDAALIAGAASYVFSRPEQFLEFTAPGVEETLVQRTEGHYTDDGSRFASGFVPITDVPRDTLMRDWKLASSLDGFIQGVLAQNTNASAAYFVSHNDVTRYYSESRLEGLPPDFRVTEHFLFADAVPALNPDRQTRWTDLYDDPAGLGLMVSAISPIYTQAGGFIGIIGIDFRLVDLAAQIEIASFGESSYSVMINGEGRAIAFPDQAYRDLLGRAPTPGEFGVVLTSVSTPFAPVVEAMRASEDGLVRVVADSLDKYVAYAPIAGTDWSLGTIMDTEAVFAGVALLETELMGNMTALIQERYVPISVLLIGIVLSIAMFFAYRLTAPLRQLTCAAENIGARKWDTPLPDASSDEVGLLSQTLGSMAYQLQALVGNLENRVQERTQELNTALEGLQRTTEEKDRMYDELRMAQRLEAIGQLAAGVAHEINTPAQYVGDNLDFLRGATQDQRLVLDRCFEAISTLADPERDAALLAEIEQLKEDVDLEFLNDEVASALDSSREGILQISSIVRSMKDFSHPGEKEKEPVDINRALDATVTVAKNEWKYVARIEAHLEADLPEVYAHAIELKQVFLNIVVNAAHAIEKRQKDGNLAELGVIRIATEVEGGFVNIRFRDNGCGIPQDVIERIYDPFFTTKEVGKGTGQGLSIVHRIVSEKHGGEIRLASTLNEFTEFQILLPLGDPLAESRGSEAA
ncbi:MAG: ATP-binding protein [Pseudomonadota bacterium]